MSIIICPNCKSILHQFEKTLKCENGHSFDFSKGGYINLLLANQKKKNNPGDNKIMLDARDKFLSTGHYDFLIEGIESAFHSFDKFATSNIEMIHLLDLGCGTGYYTRNIFKQKRIKKIGIDISKIGIAKASKKDKTSTYLVGSAFNLPIADNSVDLLLNIFAPIHLEELNRVLKSGGYFVKVIPTGDHMKEVAELVYEEFIAHQSSIKENLETNSKFQIVKIENLKRTIFLTGLDLHNFISMTPYLYKFKQEQLDSLKELSVTISFEIIIGKYN
ncbi:MAG: methyltransferase domain-containing protein [Saprospiraceae bacterium]